MRCQQYKDDLLAACLQAALTAPLELVDVNDLEHVLKTALKLGLGFAPLAVIALDAFETWMRERREQLQPLLPVLLPAFNGYLTTDSGGDKSNDTTFTPYKSLKRKRLQGLTNAPPQLSDAGNPMEDIRMRVLRLIGGLGGENKWIVKRQMQGEHLAWDSKQKCEVLNSILRLESRPLSRYLMRVL